MAPIGKTFPRFSHSGNEYGSYAFGDDYYELEGRLTHGLPIGQGY